MFEMILGIHSIEAVLKVRPQCVKSIYCTDEGLSEFIKKTQLNKSKIPNIQILAPHGLQERAKEYFRQLDLEPIRVPSQIFAITEPKLIYDLNDFKKSVSKTEKVKILALDNISDVHNGGAILRTAAFYGFDFVLLPSDKTFGFTPSFYRIASGSTEYLNLVRISSLPRALTSLKEDGFHVIGLSEHAQDKLPRDLNYPKIILVLGAEDVGLSNAVMRNIDSTFSITSRSPIKSLNVSAAAAIAMEMCFPIKA
jgi:23S rRNA (guanosine2251-2'-O)-methyltransferase